MAIPKLTEGALEKILSGVQAGRPVVQILAQKDVSEGKGQRYRFLLSDGKCSYQCCIMIGPITQRVVAGEFEKYTVIRLNKYVCNRVGGGDKKVIVLTEPEILVTGASIGRKIGNPLLFGGVSTETRISSKSCTGGLSVSLMSNASANNGFKGFKSGATVAAAAPYNGAKQAVHNMSGYSITEKQIYPISQISPYQNRWAIRGRVTNKSALKSWNNAKGEGTLFSFHLADESGEIRITAFRTECDKYFEMVQLGRVYTLTKATIKQANKKWTDVEHEYELTLRSDSTLEPADDHDTSCPQISFNFVKIGQLDAVLPNSVVDIAGVCRDPGEVYTIVSKNSGKELKKRDISLVDDSETEIRLTIWNNEAENFSANTGSVVVVKKARLTDYAGKSLSAIGSSLIQIDPDLPEAQELRGWFQRRGVNIDPNSLSFKSSDHDLNIGENQYLNSISREKVISSPNAALVTNCKATVTQTGKVHIYMACPDGCKKKLIEMNNGFYKCDKCNKDVMQGDHRMIMKFCISDATNSVWVTAFHEEAEKLIGKNAKDLAAIKEQNEEEFDEIIGSLNFKTFQFRLRTKMDNFKEETRTRTNLISAATIKKIDYARKLLNEINEMIA